MVSVNKYDDLKLIPKSLMSSSDFLAKAIWTMLKNVGKLHYSKIQGEFFRTTGFQIEDFFDFGEKDWELYFKMKKLMFTIDDKGYAKTKDYVESQ